MNEVALVFVIIFSALGTSMLSTYATGYLRKLAAPSSSSSGGSNTTTAKLRSFSLRLLNVPQVLWFLAAGMTFNRLYPGITSSTNAPRTQPYIDFSLSVIGLQLGSHLNAKSVGPLRWQLLKFLFVFFPIVFFTVLVGTSLLFPTLLVFAPLVASIAMERSSPEAMAGISEAQAYGPFTTSTMCVAAIQDVVALVGYILFSAFLKQEDQGTTLNSLISMLVATSVSIALGTAIIKFLTPLTTSSVSLATTVVIFVMIHHRWDSELLLSAVLTGVLTNWQQPHQVTKFVEDSEGLVSLVLFTVIGLRINILTYAAEGLPAVGLFLLRLLGLALGGFFGAKVAKWNHPESRWLGLITQLAIALTLVQRMEEQFPTAAPLARATGASVLLSLSFGPPALQLVLNRVGEADKQPIQLAPQNTTSELLSSSGGAQVGGGSFDHREDLYLSGAESGGGHAGKRHEIGSAVL